MKKGSKVIVTDANHSWFGRRGMIRLINPAALLILVETECGPGYFRSDQIQEIGEDNANKRGQRSK